MKIGVLLPLLVGLIGCGASVESGDNAGGAAGAAKAGSAGGSRADLAGSPALAQAGADSAATGGSATVAPALGEPTCPTHEPLNSHEFGSLAEKQQAFVGRWLQCSKQGIGPDDAAGIDVAPDGKFTILVRSATDELVAGVGVLHQGRVVVTATDVEFQSPGLTELSQMLFSDETPYRMYAFNTDFIGYDYIRVSAE